MEEIKSGFVTIVGRPNVGKSTLLNTIIERKLAITSSTPQTTRNIIQGVYNDEDSQIIFIDTPGIHKPKDKLGGYLNKQSYIMMNDVDLILFVVEADKKIGNGDKFVIEKLKEYKKIILVINKIDKISKDELLVKISEYKDLMDFIDIVPVSSLNNINIEEIIKVIKDNLSNNGKYYDEEYITNVNENFIVREYIREQILNNTFKEVPHKVNVEVLEIKKKSKLISIYASIIVDRESLKKIIVGKNASMLKKIGMNSRILLEEYYDNKVFLDLRVKCVENWREKESYLAEFGFNKFE